MRISDLFKMGIRNLTRRKARTVLTVLGVVIGSLSIIIMVSIGYGVNNNFNSQVMEQGGLTTITIDTYAAIMDESGNYADTRQQKLNESLVEQIKAIEHVKTASPVINKGVTIDAGKYELYTQITAMDYKTFGDFDFPELAFGNYPSAQDQSPIVFGFKASSQFMDPKSRNWNPVEVDLQKSRLELKINEFATDPKKKEFKFPLKNIAQMVQTDGEYDFYIYMDMDYFKTLYKKYCNSLSLEDRKRAIKSIEEYQQIKLNVDNVKNVTKVQKEIEKLGYQSYSQMQYLEPLQEASQTLQMVLGVLGAISMIVSAINIANTMIMSIYERTKEIGIMKVLGCLISDVRKLFLFEASMIGLFGGLIGIALGYIASWLVNKFGAPLFKALMSGNYMYDMTNTKFSIIPIYLPVLSLAIAILVGLVSGYFPARRATKISAIEAMKTDN